MKAEVGDTYKREAVTTPAGEAVTYSSSDKKIATVDENGRVTAVAEGKATITAKSGNVKASYNVVVSKSSGSTTTKAPIAKLPTSQLKDGMTNEYYDCPEKHHYCVFSRIDILKFVNNSGRYRYSGSGYPKGTTPICRDEFGNVTTWNNDVPGIHYFEFQAVPWRSQVGEYDALKKLTKISYNDKPDAEWLKVNDKYKDKMRWDILKKMQADGFYDENFNPLKDIKKMATEIGFYQLTNYRFNNVDDVLNKNHAGYAKYYNDNSLTPAQRLEGYFKEWEKLWKSVDLDKLFPKYRN